MGLSSAAGTEVRRCRHLFIAPGDLGGLPLVELVRQSAAVYSDWERCYQVVVIAPRGRSATSTRD
jgi:hypothetical protein